MALPGLKLRCRGAGCTCGGRPSQQRRASGGGGGVAAPAAAPPPQAAGCLARPGAVTSATRAVTPARQSLLHMAPNMWQLTRRRLCRCAALQTPVGTLPSLRLPQRPALRAGRRGPAPEPRPAQPTALPAPELPSRVPCCRRKLRESAPSKRRDRRGFTGEPGGQRRRSGLGVPLPPPCSRRRLFPHSCARLLGVTSVGLKMSHKSQNIDRREMQRIRRV